MKSIKNYSNDKLSYMNSIQSIIENKPALTFESLITTHGASIDSLFNKMAIYNNRLKNPNYIHESAQDVSFNIEEQYAARDILLNICEQYEIALYEELCTEFEIPIDEAITSAKDLLNKIKDAAKKGSDKLKDAVNNITEKLKAVKEFISDAMKNAIKSAKELVNRFTDMMISIGTNFVDLVKKLGGSDDDFGEFEGMVKEAVKAEKTAKENIYESISNYIKSGEEISEERINEFLGFGKKKDDAPKDDTKKGGNEYDAAADAKAGKETGKKGGMIWQTIKKILLQMVAYYAATIILPALVTLFFGPIAGAIVEVLAKAIWSSATIYKQVKDMIKTCKSEEYKKSKWWKKGLRWLLFIVSMYFACKTLKNTAMDGVGIVDKWMSGKISEVLPSDAVQGITKIFNNFFKWIAGENAAGYDKLVEAQNKVYTQVIEIAGEGKAASDEAKANFDDHANKGQFKASETNTFDKTEQLAGKDLADKMREVANAGEKSSKAVLDNVTQVQVDTPGVTAFAIDGATLGKIGRAEYIEQIAKQIGVNPSDIDISQVTDTALRQATSGRAGTFFQVIIKGDATQEMADAVNKAVQNVASNAGMGGGFFHMMSNIADNISPVKQIISWPADLFKNSFAAFGGLFPIAVEAIKENGPFKLRLGSARTGNYIYLIEEDGIEKMPYDKFVSTYKDRNPKVFSNMQKIINDNAKLLEKAKSELESKKSLSRDDKKKLKSITAQLEMIKEGKSEYDVLIFSTHDKRADMDIKESELNEIDTLIAEGKKSEDDKDNRSDKLFPVAFINPLIIAGGDLTRQTKSKGPRANLYFMKGLYARWELLPVDGGMSKSDITDFFGKLLFESVKAAFNMTPDMPCIKKLGKYKVNPESLAGDKDRKDFGSFTNQEIVDIMNSPKSAADYLGGEYASDILSGGSHDYSEQTNTEKRKKHHEKVVKQYTDIMNDDSEVKDLINNSKSLKKVLLNDDGTVNQDEVDKLSKNFIRVENNYAKGKNKKGLFKRLISWFKGEKDNDVDPKELEKLSFMLASKRIKLKKQRVAEGLETEMDFTILEANIEIIQKELSNYYYNEYNKITESLDDTDETFDLHEF